MRNAWCALVLLAAAPAPKELSPQTFDALHALIKPDAAKVDFEQIPWMTSLWEARKKAAAEGKLLMMWVGDPHPLGVT